MRWTGRTAASIVFGILTLILSTGMLQAEVRKSPRIELKDETFDFGKVPAGTDVVHVFELKNAGDALLEIQKVQPS